MPSFTHLDFSTPDVRSPLIHLDFPLPGFTHQDFHLASLTRVFTLPNIPVRTFSLPGFTHQDFPHCLTSQLGLFRAKSPYLDFSSVKSPYLDFSVAKSPYLDFFPNQVNQVNLDLRLHQQPPKHLFLSHIKNTTLPRVSNIKIQLNSVNLDLRLHQQSS